jgi:steroid delta-isomerase-like uncharacterized protein
MKPHDTNERRGLMPSPAEMEKLTKERVDAYNAHDVERYLSYFTDDVVYNSLPLGTISNGKEELRASLHRNFEKIPDARIEVASYFSADDRECMEYTLSGTHPGTITRFLVRAVLVTELSGDKTRRLSVYYDSAEMTRQLGIHPRTLLEIKSDIR